MAGVIDIHHHWINEEGYLDRLLVAMDRSGVERTGLIAMGRVGRELFLSTGVASGCVSDEDVAAAVRRRPDRFFGYGFMRPGHSVRDDVDRAAERGLIGLKFHLPTHRYDDEVFFPLYDRAQALGLPCLFHTGIFTPPRPMPEEGISSAHCMPIFLDTIANRFSDLQIILAHMGICYGEEAGLTHLKSQ